MILYPTKVPEKGLGHISHRVILLTVGVPRQTWNKWDSSKSEKVLRVVLRVSVGSSERLMFTFGVEIRFVPIDVTHHSVLSKVLEDSNYRRRFPCVIEVCKWEDSPKGRFPNGKVHKSFSSGNLPKREDLQIFVSLRLSRRGVRREVRDSRRQRIGKTVFLSTLFLMVYKEFTGPPPPLSPPERERIPLHVLCEGRHDPHILEGLGP